jgi:hypothetical protein
MLYEPIPAENMLAVSFIQHLSWIVSVPPSDLKISIMLFCEACKMIGNWQKV